MAESARCPDCGGTLTFQRVSRGTEIRDVTEIESIRELDSGETVFRVAAGELVSDEYAEVEREYVFCRACRFELTGELLEMS